MSLEQNKEGVMIRCADGTTYHGDILVGADGAYSGVRQALYKRMDKAGTLPPSDLDELNKGFICMVGTTDPLDPVKYPGLDSEIANINQIIGKNNLYSVRTVLFFSIISSLFAQYRQLTRMSMPLLADHCSYSIVERLYCTRKQDLLERHSPIIDCQGSVRAQVQELGMGPRDKRADDQGGQGLFDTLWRYSRRPYRCHSTGQHLSCVFGGQVIRYLALWSNCPYWRWFVCSAVFC